MDQNTRPEHKEVSLNLCSGSPQEITQDRLQTKDTLGSRIEIKISFLTRNRIRRSGLKGKDSTDHVTAMDRTSLRDTGTEFSNFCNYEDIDLKFCRLRTL